MCATRKDKKSKVFTMNSTKVNSINSLFPISGHIGRDRDS